MPDVSVFWDVDCITVAGNTEKGKNCIRAILGASKRVLMWKDAKPALNALEAAVEHWGISIGE